MGDVVKLANHLRIVRRNRRLIKKPAVVPLQSALESQIANTREFAAARFELPSFPFRNGALRNAGDRSQFLLRQLEDGLADMKHRRHGPTLFANEFIRQDILCGNDCQPRLPFMGEGKMDVSQILTTIMTVKGWKQAKLAKEIGVGQGQISKWMSNAHSPNKRKWDAVLDILEGDPRLAHLLDSLRAPSIPGIGPEFYSALRKMPAAQRNRIVNLVIGLAEDEVA